ncbi:MAG: SIS domain-containing protein [Mariprofundales bacterium]
MDNISRIYGRSNSVGEFSKGYFSYLSSVLDNIDVREIERFVDVLLNARERGDSVFFIGNGGSAATASHFVNDIGVGTLSWEKPFCVMSLSDNSAVVTAIGNDRGYENIFVEQLRLYLKPEDVVVFISASGNSSNIVKALDFANAMGAMTIGLTSFDGGQLRKDAVCSIHVPAGQGEYGPAEDAHMILDHLVSAYLSRWVKAEAAVKSS